MVDRAVAAMIEHFDYDVRDAPEAEREEWVDGAEDAPHTHIVRYHPSFELLVKLPPWVEPDEWLAAASMGWNELLAEAGEAWTEPGGYAFLEIDLHGSTQSIDEVEP
jgi:hypothetical protein